ncbi:MAG: hypothetical protein ACYTFY_21045 [Planctomycetota bacterium]|jgi:hypothetical protein
MTIYLISTVLILIAALLFLSASRGIPHPANRLKSPILDLLRHGYNGGYLKIRQDLLSKKFLLIRKYITADDDFGIQFTFPQYNELYFSEVEEFCKSRDMDYKIEDGYLVIDFKKGWAEMSRFCEEVFLHIFDILGEDRVYTVLKNASPDIIHKVKHLKE